MKKKSSKYSVIITKKKDAEVIQNSKKKSIELKMQRFVSVTAMMLLIATNMLGALLLIPFLLFFKGFQEYAIIILFAVGFGFVFNLMIHSIEQLGDKHHIIAGIIVPLCGLLDLIILFTLLDKITKTIQITHTYNYSFIVGLFIVAFIIPYLIDIFRGKHSFKNE